MPDPYRVTRSPHSRATPWQWRCEAVVTTGLVAARCGAWGLGRTRAAADDAGREHVADAHPTEETRRV
ncbi:hypothetical protein [Streptomyces hoynatensis]|uniref:Uncharacterized protein n=1 Tax=Streptomyces hoynatensis TaxID=1141874 RepID=A0A3A9YXI5_9ACTN|nr:hypothetical protein [Streptomyces hoynatensis]RKN40771.1 hypothetical protein D7294_16915 [Streptomyces hoynatensis]